MHARKREVEEKGTVRVNETERQKGRERGKEEKKKQEGEIEGV